MKVKEIIKILENDGWYLSRTKGSHRQSKHNQKSDVNASKLYFIK